jgi:hypothetical protein
MAGTSAQPGNHDQVDTFRSLREWRDQTTPRWRIGRPGAIVSAAAMMAWASMQWCL